MKKIVCRPRASCQKMPGGHYNIHIEGVLENAHPGEHLTLVAKRVIPGPAEKPDEETIQLVVPTIDGLRFSFGREIKAGEKWEYLLTSPDGHFDPASIKAQNRQPEENPDLPEIPDAEVTLLDEAPCPILSSVMTGRLPDFPDGQMVFVLVLILKGAADDEAVKVELAKNNAKAEVGLHENLALKTFRNGELRRVYLLKTKPGNGCLIAFSSPSKRFEPRAVAISEAAEREKILSIEQLRLPRNEAEELQKFYAPTSANEVPMPHPFDDISTRHTDLSERLAGAPEARPTGDIAIPLPGATSQEIVLTDEVFTNDPAARPAQTKPGADLTDVEDLSEVDILDEPTAPEQLPLPAAPEPSLIAMAAAQPPAVPKEIPTQKIRRKEITAESERRNPNKEPVFERRVAPAVPPVAEEEMANRLMIVLIAVLLLLVGAAAFGGVKMYKAMDSMSDVIANSTVSSRIGIGPICKYADPSSPGTENPNEALIQDNDEEGMLYVVLCDDNKYYMVRYKSGLPKDLGVPKQFLLPYNNPTAPAATE